MIALIACNPTSAHKTDSPDALSAEADQIPEYDRNEWGGWIDVDRDCQDTRQEVLIAEAQGLIEYEDDRRCRVASGTWTDLYTGEVFTDPSKLDVDHVVALKEAHEAGGWRWSREQKRAYANDLTPVHLMAVSASANRSKGSRSPSEWLPPRQESRCIYLRARLSILDSYGLEYSCAEYLSLMAEHCE